MFIYELYVVLFSSKCVLKHFLEDVQFFTGNAKNLHNMLSVPLVSSYFLLMLLLHSFLPGFFELFLFPKILQSNPDRIFTRLIEGVRSFRVLLKVLLKEIDQFSRPLGFFRPESNRVKESSIK
jgi:hypothetical protein